jgi:hypothetical protein
VTLEKIWRDSNEMACVGEIIGILNRLKKEHGLLPEQASMDASGAGRPMANRLHELGYMVNKFFGGSTDVRFDSECYNQRAEVWSRGCATIKACGVIVPDNEELRMQLLQGVQKRHSSGKFLMQSKEDMIKDGMESPDEADAVLGALMPAPQARSVNLLQSVSTQAGQINWTGNDEDDNNSGERRYFT